MCVDKETSWTAAIAGTVVNGGILYNLQGDKSPGARSVRGVVVATQCVLALQVIDALQWGNIERGTRKAWLDYAGAWVIMLQPLLLVCAAWYSQGWKHPKHSVRGPAMNIVSVASLGFVLHALLTTVKADLRPDADDRVCKAIQYDVMSDHWLVLYGAVCVAALALLASPLVGATAVALFGLSYLAGRVVVADADCDVVSTWLWSFCLTTCFLYTSYRVSTWA